MRPPLLWPPSLSPPSKAPWTPSEPASGPLPVGRDQPCKMQQKGNTVCAPHSPPGPVPFAACCCSRILRVRAVVPLGMLIMYFPSISAVTRRRLVGPVKLSSSWRARAAGGGGGGERLLGWNVLLGWGLDALQRAHTCPLSPCFHLTGILYPPSHPQGHWLNHRETQGSGHSGVAEGCGGPPRLSVALALCPPAGSPPSPGRIPSDGETAGWWKSHVGGAFTGVITF